LQGVFTHQQADLLGVDDKPLMAELGADLPVSLSLEFVADCRDLGHDPRVVGLL